MKMRELMIASAMLAQSAAVQAELFTWDGGGADNNWLTAGNWNTAGAPADDGTATLAFSGNMRTAAVNNFTNGTVFAGINFLNDYSSGKTAGFTLSGSRITLAGDVTTQLLTLNGTINDTIATDLTLNGFRTFTVDFAASKAHNLTVSGNIGETGGAQGLVKGGGGTLTLSGANTYSGKTTVNGGTVVLYSLGNIGGSSSSLGAPATAADAIIDLNAALDYKGGTATSDRTINLTGGSGQLRQNGSGILTLTGGITASNQGLSVRGGAGITATGVIALGNGGVSRTDNGVLTLSNPANSFAGNLTISHGTVSAASISNSGSPSAIGQGSRIYFGQTGWPTTGRLLFTGASGGECNRALTVSTQDGTYGGTIENSVAGQSLIMSGNVNAAGTGTAPLWLTGAGDGVMSGVISGNLRVSVTGSGTWALSGVNSYVGATSVSTGILLINGSTAAGSKVTVGPAGTLGGTGTVHGVVNVTAGGKLAPGSNGVGALTLDKGSAADLTLNGNTLEFEITGVAGAADSIAIAGTLVLNGVNTVKPVFPAGPPPLGSYTLMTYAAQSGFGTLVVDPGVTNAMIVVGTTNVILTVVDTSTVVWKGDGIANLWDTTTANWLPEFYTDYNVAVFDDTGSASPAINIFPDPVMPFSVTVDAGTNAYTIGGAAITGAGGLTKSGTNTLTLTGANSYSGLTAVNAGRLILSGSLSNSTVSVVTGAVLQQNAGSVIAGVDANLNCLGSATLAGTNTYGGITTVGVNGIPDINLMIRNNDALGSSSNGVILYGGNANTENRLNIGVSGIVVRDETLTFAGSATRAGLHYTLNYGTGTWDGHLIGDGAHSYLNCDSAGGTLVIGSSSDDTVTGTHSSLSFRGNGTVILHSTVSIGSTGVNRDDGGTAVINSAGNLWGNTSLLQGTLRLGVADALPVTTVVTIGKSGNTAHARFDLNGQIQSIAGLADLHNTSVGGGTQKISSATPAMLVVSNSTANTFGKTGSVIEGAVTLVKSGSGTLTLTSSNTTSGSLIVRGGTLVVSAAGSFGSNSTNIVVENSATLTLQSSESLADSATLTIADTGARVNLAAEVNERVAYLFWGATPKRAGTYGATGSGAAVIDDQHFAGSGILTVLRDHAGAVIIIR